MKEKFINIDEYKIRYLESGDSDNVLVLIHGLGASAERWEYVIPFFSKHFRVIVPDLIGFGFSDKPTVDYTPDFFSEFLKKFLEKLGISNPVMIGSSLGGQITAEYVAKNNSVKKLVLVSPSGVMKNSTPALDAYIMAALYPNQDTAKNAYEMMAGAPKEIDQKIIDGFVKRMQLPNAKMAFMSTLLGLKNSNAITEKLSLISIPTLLIWGELDPVIPVKHAEPMVAALKDCKFFSMTGSGHTPYVDNPHDFVRIVMDFIGK